MSLLKTHRRRQNKSQTQTKHTLITSQQYQSLLQHYPNTFFHCFQCYVKNSSNTTCTTAYPHHAIGPLTPRTNYSNNYYYKQPNPWFILALFKARALYIQMEFYWLSRSCHWLENNNKIWFLRIVTVKVKDDDILSNLKSLHFISSPSLVFSKLCDFLS